jgi:hypothetical protein
MARIRTVKPAYPKHRKTRKVTRDARLLNIHLWNLADDEGRLQELTQWIIGEVFPTDEDVTPGVLKGWLDELAEAGLIVRYEVDDERYIYCHDWDDHQRIERPSPSVLPAPEMGLRVVKDGSRNAPGGSDEASPPEEEGKGKGNKEGESATALPTADAAPLSHLLADLIAGNDPDEKRPRVTRRWADAERLLLDRDDRRRDEAERLIRWCQADEFWRGNVLSMPKFREKYGQLYQAAVRSAAGRRASTPASRVEADLAEFEAEHERLAAEEAAAA